MGSNGFVDLNWPWLPIGWVGCCTLGFTFAHGSIKPNLQQASANLPYLHARCTRSVFQWYECIVALLVPFIETTDIMIKATSLYLIKSYSTLNSEPSNNLEDPSPGGSSPILSSVLQHHVCPSVIALNTPEMPLTLAYTLLEKRKSIWFFCAFSEPSTVPGIPGK